MFEGRFGGGPLLKKIVRASAGRAMTSARGRAALPARPRPGCLPAPARPPRARSPPPPPPPHPRPRGLALQVDSIKDLVTDTNLECSATGIMLQAMDSSHVALVSLTLKSDGFDMFRCDRNISLGLNLVRARRPPPAAAAAAAPRPPPRARSLTAAPPPPFPRAPPAGQRGQDHEVRGQ